ncbi:uncharacterized protein LOC121788400 [Salvia splendens]|uniref:uncharacterized protein LOC121788400 n=1 Tax=Salvia splendens TaxID=180675 RepID=UPI001C273F8E|nr:uncharacterized protein LOC121788400 [Salvia splendens]
MKDMSCPAMFRSLSAAAAAVIVKMGICVPYHAIEKPPVDSRRRGSSSLSSSVKVVDLEGRLEEFRQAVTAEEVLSRHPDCYLCSADNMVVNSQAPQLAKDHALQPGQIYFLMPLSRSLTPLSLEDLCDLAIKTSRTVDIGADPFLHGCKRLRISEDGNCRNFVTS